MNEAEAREIVAETPRSWQECRGWGLAWGGLFFIVCLGSRGPALVFCAAMALGFLALAWQAHKEVRAISRERH